MLYSVFTAACGLATSFGEFVLFRIGLGLGMGGEWASGATLVSETWSAEHRGKALALHAERLGDWLRARGGGQLFRSAGATDGARCFLSESFPPS